MIIGGAIVAEEIVKDLILPAFITSEVIGGASIAGGITTAAVVEEVK